MSISVHARLEYRVAEAALGPALVEDRQQQSEAPTSIKVVVEMPANVIARTVVE
jgi:hypothetical protein